MHKANAAIWALRRPSEMHRAKLWLVSGGFVLGVVPWVILFPLVLSAQEAVTHPGVDPEIAKWGFLAAAASVGISAIAGAIAGGMVLAVSPVSGMTSVPG